MGRKLGTKKSFPLFYWRAAIMHCRHDAKVRARGEKCWSFTVKRTRVVLMSTHISYVVLTYVRIVRAFLSHATTAAAAAAPRSKKVYTSGQEVPK